MSTNTPSTVQTNWSYLLPIYLVATLGMPLFGPLSDRFGRKRAMFRAIKDSGN